MKTFPNEVKQDLAEAQNNYCRVLNCYEPIHSIHHKLPNNRANRKKFELFIHSPQNGVGLCFSCHTNNAHLFKITEKEAIVYENHLRKLKEE